MKRFVMAVALASVLSGTAMAGDIPTSDVTSPAPPDNTRTALPGEIPSTGGELAPIAESDLVAVLLGILSAL